MADVSVPIEWVGIVVETVGSVSAAGVLLQSLWGAKRLVFYISSRVKLYCEFIKRNPTIKEKQWRTKLQFAVRKGTLAIFMEQLRKAEDNEMRIRTLMN